MKQIKRTTDRSVRGKRGKKRLQLAAYCTSQFQVPIPKDERERVKDLRSYQILDTPAEKAFDLITQLATEVCGTPIALVSLIDSDRQWFKSKVGVKVRETPRHYALCAHAIMCRDLYIVRDAAQDKRFASNPLVVSDPKIRFYAGMPLVSPDNHALGTLCVIDHVPRVLSPQQRRVLKLLSRQVVAELVMRRSLMEARAALRQRQRAEREWKKKVSSALGKTRVYRRGVGELRREIQVGMKRVLRGADRLRSHVSTAQRRQEADRIKAGAQALLSRIDRILDAMG